MANDAASDKPILTLPASESVTVDGTLAVAGASYTDSFAQSNPGAMYLNISDTIGLLSGFYPGDGGATGAPGDGSTSITFQGSYADVQDIINSLTYVATGTSASDSIAYDIWNQAGVQTTGTIPVTIGGSPQLTEPSSESVASGSSVAVSGSYTDSFAASNAGAMYLSISDSNGTLSSDYAGSGGSVVAPGSGSNSIVFSGSYQDVQQILNNLTYVAGSAGADSIRFDMWNQAGTETTGSVPVTVTGGAGGGGSTVSWTGAANDGQWNTPANWSDNAVPTSGDTVLIAPGTPNVPSLANATLSGETIVLGSDSPVGPSVFFNDVTLGAGTTLESSGSGGSVGESGTLTVASGATIAGGDGAALGITSSSSSPATLVNYGTITDSGNGSMSLNAVVENHGVISDSPVGSSNNELAIGDAGSILNSGTIIDDGGLIALEGPVLGGTVAFTGSGGSLLLGSLNPFAQGAIVTGFGNGDRMVVGGFNPTGMSFSGGTLTLSGGPFSERIPFAGALGLGNFALNTTTAGANGAANTTLFYAPPGGASGTPSGEPDISAPGTASVAQSGTLALNDVSIANAPTLTLDITATSGTLYMSGASGNGTNHLSIAADTPASQVNADLASLRYVAAAGTTGDTIEISAAAPFSVSGTTDTIRYIPVSISGGTQGPALNEPSSASVAPGNAVAISGSYSDSFARSNPGKLFLAISDSSGRLTATDGSGNPVAGSGSNSITVSTDYASLNAELQSLTYTAAATGASTDTIHFDVWNQAGVETTGTTAISIGSAPINAVTAGIASGPTLLAGSAAAPQGDLSQVAQSASIGMANDLLPAVSTGTGATSMALAEPTTAAAPAFALDQPTHTGVVLPSH